MFLTETPGEAWRSFDSGVNFSTMWPMAAVPPLTDDEPVWWVRGRTLFLSAYRGNFAHAMEDSAKLALNRALHGGVVDRHAHDHAL